MGRVNNKVYSQFKVIKGTEIINAIEIGERKHFFPHHRRNEEDYVNFMKLSQPMIIDFEEGKEISEYTYYDSVDGMEESLWQCFIAEGVLIRSRCVVVDKRTDGYYLIDSGRHRAYVASKYDLKIIVYVVERKCR